MGNLRLCCVDHPARCSSAPARRPQMSLMKGMKFQKRLQKENKEKRGWSTPFESKEILAQARRTCQERYGVENPFAVESIQETIRGTNQIRYGCDNPSQNKDVQHKKEETWLRNLGVRNPKQSKEVREKGEVTCMLRYGARHPLQNAEIARRVFIHGVQKRGYILPSGKLVKLAGYEALVLDELLQTGFAEEDFDFAFKQLPAILYQDPKTQRERRYYPDFFVPRLNWIIEVKSDYTYRRERATNIAKYKACRAKGYAFNLLIRDPRPGLVLLQVSRPPNDKSKLDC
jgi:hypothetical protein